MDIPVIYPPNPINPSFATSHRIFLGGSIEMGTATEWQGAFMTSLNERMRGSGDFVFYNPRRKDWDATWIQEFTNPQFFQQVTWELDALDAATHIVLFFEPGTKSPISLLELGLHARLSNVIVCVVCPDGFWRKGNVDIVCNKYGLLQFNTLEEAQEFIYNSIS